MVAANQKGTGVPFLYLKPLHWAGWFGNCLQRETSTTPWTCELFFSWPVISSQPLHNSSQLFALPTLE